MFSRPIAIGLSPNTESDDVLRAAVTLLAPWTWKKGSAVSGAESWFCRYFDAPYAVSFNAGRSALFALLSAMGISKGDEVLLQSFTCVAVPNAIVWMHAKPVYVDIDETLNIDPVSLETQITSKTKAIIVQHTFGIPANMEAILKIAKKHNLYVIEDCAHALGASYKGKKVGTLGDAAFFSFGRDKVISSVFGGMAITRNRILGEKVRKFQQNIEYPSYTWIAQQLLHPVLFSVILPLYHVLNIGKVILFLSQKVHLLSFPVYPDEKCGKKPAVFPKKYPNALANLLSVQLKKLSRYNKKREDIAKWYYEGLKNNQSVELPVNVGGAIYLRFTIQVMRADSIRKKAQQSGMLLGNWYTECIAPKGVSPQKVYFDVTKTKKAAKATKRVLNLPTYPHITKSDVQKIVALFADEVSHESNSFI